MFLLLLTYQGDLAEIDRLLPAHNEYLRRNYEDGTFLMSGPRVPRCGGVILAGGDDRARIDRVIGQDPFVCEGAASYEVLQWNATRSAITPREHAAPGASTRPF
ncbi:GTP cyclohydrolase [Nocardiopsis gilva YIM 90087]|uniref:GTP cyclohydrolase n=1 Tax=Nocardiopsis gilva YIM 90087 TaxID=1235441 RepID=A0A223S010_9ACTN|nr:YciI family protein [Nocardiopsis gilva]ASU81461.1 GTP cyclohydrolase [Nocardiopsis gilva YIM 90087]